MKSKAKGPKSFLLSRGDVESQPGPANEIKVGSGRKISNPCGVCGKGVTKASRAISCDICDAWTHVRCTTRVTSAQYDECVNGSGLISFTCDLCGWASLPFSALADVGMDAVDSGAAPAAPSQVTIGVSSCCLPNILLSKGLHLLHSNVRSLIPKIPEVQILLTRTKTAIFAATETWLDASVSEAEIPVPGYSVIRQDRNRNGGGVAIYIRNDIAFNPRHDLSVDGLEAVWVELLFPRTKGILVCCCYRPPTDGEFLTKLEQSLSKVDPRSELYIMGDMNIDTSSESSLHKSYVSLLDVLGLCQIISEPTRITPTSSSTLDHIIVSMGERVTGSGVVGVGLSDHLVTYCSRGVPTNGSNLSNIRRIRCFRDYSAQRLKDELKMLSWSALLQSSDIDFCLEEFHVALDKIAPFRDVRVRARTNPWMNSHILSGIKLRDTLLSRFRKDRGNRSLYSEYCKVRNSLQRDIKMAKESFFSKKINESKGNSTKLWRHLKSLGYKSSTGSSCIVLEQEGRKIFDRYQVACTFNKFYTSVAANLVQLLPSPRGLYNTSSYVFRQFYRHVSGFSSSFVLSPVSRTFIRK